MERPKDQKLKIDEQMWKWNKEMDKLEIQQTENYKQTSEWVATTWRERIDNNNIRWKWTNRCKRQNKQRPIEKRKTARSNKETKSGKSAGHDMEDMEHK